MNVNKEYIPFKILYDLQDRKKKYLKAKQTIEAHNKTEVVLIILEPHPRAKIAGFQNCRFSVEADRPLTYLREQINKKKLNFSPSQSLFLYTGNVMLVGNSPLSVIRDAYQDEDGFLYINYAEMDIY